jgi:hypothetical protein
MLYSPGTMTKLRRSSRMTGLLRILPWVMTLGLLASACGGDSCEVGSEQHRTELYFGLDRANAAPVSEQEWLNFVDTVVTPRFGQGLTMFDVDGQYLMGDGTLIREDSKVIILLHDGSSTPSSDIDTIREEYKQRFNQESVLRIDSVSCVAF